MEGRDGGEAKRGEVPLLLELDGTPAAVLRHDERKESEARATGPWLRVLRVVLRQRWPQKAAQYYHDGRRLSHWGQQCTFFAESAPRVSPGGKSPQQHQWLMRRTRWRGWRSRIMVPLFSLSKEATASYRVWGLDLKVKDAWEGP